MTSVTELPMSAGSTRYPWSEAPSPDEMAAEDFYRYGGVPRRAVTIRAVQPSVAPRLHWIAGLLEARINDLLSLEPGWDGGFGDPPTDQSVTAGVAVIGQLVSEVAVAPFVFPLPDGGLQFEWHAGRESVEVEVDEEGSPHALVTDRAGRITLHTVFDLGDRATISAVRRAVDSLSMRLLGAG